MKRVFISYAHEDTAFRDALAVHLQVLCTAGIIVSWHDGEIGPGEDWKASIDRELRAADIIVLLVSASFLASRSCQELELSPALNRWNASEVTIVPVIVRACDWDASPLARLQVLPAQARPVATWPHQDGAWTEVTRKIRAAATRKQCGADPPRPPGASPVPLRHPRSGQGTEGSAPESMSRASVASIAGAATAPTVPVASAESTTRKHVLMHATSQVPRSGQEVDHRLRREAMVWAAIPGVLIATVPMIKFFDSNSKADMPIYGIGVGALLVGAWVSSIVVKGSGNTSKLRSLKTGGCVVVLASIALVIAGMVRSCL